MAKRNPRPELVRIEGVMHKLTVGKIVSHDEQGRPWEIQLLYDDQAAEIAGNEEFMTLYVRKHMTDPDPTKAGGTG